MDHHLPIGGVAGMVPIHSGGAIRLRGSDFVWVSSSSIYGMPWASFFLPSLNITSITVGPALSTTPLPNVG
jgi:hypothetical protein